MTSSTRPPANSAQRRCKSPWHGCLQRSKVILPIPGTSSVAHVEENIAAAALKLPNSVFEDLSAVNSPPAVLR